LVALVFVFFFSSRRRHTRFSRDWSSDVCSSDLVQPDGDGNLLRRIETQADALAAGDAGAAEVAAFENGGAVAEGLRQKLAKRSRSEERRVGKERRARGRP